MTDVAAQGEAAALPVVAWRCTRSVPDDGKRGDCVTSDLKYIDVHTGFNWNELTPKSDAQAIIDRLTHELEVARGVGKNLFGCAQELLRENVAKLHDGRLPTDLRDLRTANPSVAECIANLDMWNGRLEAAIDRQAHEKLGQHPNDEPVADGRDPMEQFP